ncbi:MAG: efflux transporter outer membrane subunit [Burkholderiaceae bacterium]
MTARLPARSNTIHAASRRVHADARGPGAHSALIACASVLVALVLAGCASSAGIRSTAQPVTAQALGLQAPAGLSPWAPSPDWWHGLGSARLDDLVAQALAGNPTLGQAQARLTRAQAQAAGVSASAGPQVNATFDATTQRYSANGLIPPPLAGSVRTTATAQIGASWEFDFFGRNRAAIAAAVGQQRAAEAEIQAARTLLANQVVRTYVQIGRLLALRDVAQRSLEQRQQLRGLIGQRVQAGLDTAVEARQGDAALPEARLQIAQIDEQIVLARHALSVLTAQRVDALDALSVDLSRLQVLALPDNVGADLLGRRADITAARWRVEAATSDIQVARAQFYPNINLNAFIGLSSIGLGKLIQADSAQYGVGPAIRLPIFDSGRLRANLGAKTADLDGAIETYNATVQDAVRDAVDQLSSLQSLVHQQREQAQTQAGTQAAFALIEQRYAAGLSTYLAVLNAESQLLAQQRLAADLSARVFDTQAALVRALGGGYAGDDRAWSPSTQTAAGGTTP